MPTVDVITPVYGDGARYLGQAYQSLRRQVLPAGWSWRWLVQADDGTGPWAADVRALARTDDRVSAGQNRRREGSGITRTIALSRATGTLVKALDADDQLTAGALARDIATMESHPTVGWATSRVLDLFPDGTTAEFHLDPEAGRIEPGHCLAHWAAHDFIAPVHPATLCVRTDLLLAVGGWMALPASEDTGLLLALDAVAAGWFHDEVGLLYRKHPAQSTNGPDYASEADRQARMVVIRRRAEALTGLRRVLT